MVIAGLVLRPFYKVLISPYESPQKHKLLTLANLLSKWQYHRRRYRQFIKSHLQELFCQFKVCSKFSTDSDPFSFCVCIICCHLDHSKYCRMMWIIELIQRKVLTVNRQRILCQIICSNTEEINFFVFMELDN